MRGAREGEERMEEETLSRHERQALRREQREEEQRKRIEEAQRVKTRKKFIIYGILAVVVVGLGFLVVRAFSSPGSGPYTSGPVHWHAGLFVEKCGVPFELPRPAGGGHDVGSPLLHTHEDQLIHIEGKVWKKEEIMLGTYVKTIGVDDEVLTEGESCSGAPAVWRMTVNEKESSEFGSYVIKDKDEIKLELVPRDLQGL